MQEQHIPVLLAEVVQYLKPQSPGWFADGTFGAGGYARAIARSSAPKGLVVGVDRDRAVLESAREQFTSDYQHRIILRHGSYENIPEIVEQLAWPKLNGIVLDLGLSSLQLADEDRGFSFVGDRPLDLRFDQERGMSTAELLASWGQDELAQILKEYGELHAPYRLAERILACRPIETTVDLVQASGLKHPRKLAQLFQALRIATNEELAVLSQALPKLFSVLRSGGRLVVVTFHSLEDRIVKRQFREWKDNDEATLLTKKPVIPGDEELQANSRARSAKLRAIEKH